MKALVLAAGNGKRLSGEGEGQNKCMREVQVSRRDEIRKTYSVLYDPSDHRIYRLIEKPQNPVNNYMGTGNCVFRNRMLEYIGQTPLHQARREKELPDLIQCAVDDGNPVKLYEVGTRYVNVNMPEDVRLAASLFEERGSPLHQVKGKYIQKEYARWSEPAPVLP